MSNPSLRSSRSSRSSTRAATSGAASSGKRSESPQTTRHATDETDREAPKSPPKRPATARRAASDEATTGPRIVTPGTALALEKKRAEKAPRPARRPARRSLSMGDRAASSSSDASEATAATVPEEVDEADSKKKRGDAAPAGKKKLPFGGGTRPIEIPPGVQRTYAIVRKQTGNIGGNGCGGAIYGELTTGSMQKMTNLMIEHAGLSRDSRFIDVGCGLGKPNLHVAQYPGVDFSYGIEMEQVRWMLGMANLQQVLEAARRDVEEGKEAEIGHKCYFAYGDITEANFFDPFTHVYMFDIGFPPRLFHQLSDMFNQSQSEYLICYHGPKLMVDKYEFDVELVVQTPTSMHGSAEGHQGYIYRRGGGGDRTRRGGKACKTKTFGVPCDPLFAEAWKTCRAGLEAVHARTAAEVEEHMGARSKRVTRSASRARREQRR